MRPVDRVLDYMKANASPEGYSSPSIRTICLDLGHGAATVIKAIYELERTGQILRLGHLITGKPGRPRYVWQVNP